MPTIGYTSVGASQAFVGDNGIGCKYAGVDGTLTKFYCGCIDLGGGGNNVWMAKYSNNAGTPNALEAHSGSAAAPASAGFVECPSLVTDGGTNLGITNAVDFWLMMTTSFGTDVRQMYDSGAANQTSIGNADISSGTFQATWSHNSFSNVILSLYGDYNASAVNSVTLREQKIRPALFKPGNAK